MSDYKITDKDIEGMLRYLKLFHPEQATREFAEGWLRFWKAKYREVAVENPGNDALERLFEAYQASKR